MGDRITVNVAKSLAWNAVGMVRAPGIFPVDED
jgi:hypothetical protein